MNPNDPDVIALSKAIFQHESGGDFNAVGDAGTSHGAGQWQPETWKAQAKDVLGDENAQMTPDNQKAVIQVSIAKDKASGLNPAQIAAKWNSGKPDGWENKIGTTTINGQQIKYNVPQYVKSVTDLYHQYKGSSSQSAGNYNPKPFSNPSDGSPGSVDFSGLQESETKPDSLGSKLQGRLKDAGGALNKAAEGTINPLSGILQTVGAGAGAVGDTVGAGLELIPVVKQAENLIGQGASALANTGPGKAVVQAGTDFAEKHPEITADIGAVGNIASVLPVGKLVGLAKDAVGAGIAKAAGKTALDGVIDDVTPNLSAGAAAKRAAKQGLTKSTLTGKIGVSAGNDVKDIAQVVADNVPNYNKLSTFTDKLNATRDAVYRLAENLKKQVAKSGQDRVYPFKELAAKMNAVEEPISLKGTAFEKQIGPIKKAALDIAQKNGGTISSLFDARKEFDQLVERTYPNLYDKENAPMRSAIRGVRDTMNQFIEDKLPAGSDFRNQLLTQSKLFTAIDSLAPKATKEIGSTSLSRFAGRHPLISNMFKTAGKGVVEGTGAGAALKTMGI